MTKKEFKIECYHTVYSGWNGKKIRINAFMFDWKEGTDTATNKFFIGFKYMIWSDVRNISKATLFDLFYQWVEHGTNLPYFVNYKTAFIDLDRFKTPMSLK